MPNKWITALKAWNTEKGGAWCVPRKGSPEYNEVKKYMEGKETPRAKSEREARNKATMDKAIEGLRKVEKETKERNIKRKEVPKVVKEKEKKPSKKVDSLASYKKGYTGAYQDYEDSKGNEVIYPTSDIKKIIELAYKNKSPREIQAEVGYNLEETAIMIYDNYINRNMENPKEYKYTNEVMKIMDE